MTIKRTKAKQTTKKNTTKHIKGKKTSKKTLNKKTIKGKKEIKKQQELITLIENTVKNSINKSRSQSNLASKLIDMNKGKISSYSKTFQSTYTSINKNGKHSEIGQSILNESTKPYIEIKNLKNGKLTITKMNKK